MALNKKKNLFEKRPFPLKLETKNNVLELYVFNEIKENKKTNMKQITLLGYGQLIQPDFFNIRINILTFEIILTRKQKNIKRD